MNCSSSQGTGSRFTHKLKVLPLYLHRSVVQNAMWREIKTNYVSILCTKSMCVVYTLYDVVPFSSFPAQFFCCLSCVCTPLFVCGGSPTVHLTASKWDQETWAPTEMLPLSICYTSPQSIKWNLKTWVNIRGLVGILCGAIVQHFTWWKWHSPKLLHIVNQFLEYLYVTYVELLVSAKEDILAKHNHQLLVFWCYFTTCS